MKILRYALSLAITLGCAAPALAQDASAGRVAASSAGQVGVRKTRDQTGAVPTARISSRLQTRVQSRIRNRIDRFYDPQANAVSPFRVAGEQAREAGKRPR